MEYLTHLVSVVDNLVAGLMVSCFSVGCYVTSAPSAAPRAVHGQAVNSTSVLVVWSPPPAARQNGVVVRYRLIYVAAADDDDDDDARAGGPTRRHVSSVSVPGSQQTHVLNGLDRWTQYKIWVAASTSAGEGPRSDVIVVQTDEDGR